jgi:hypothetical protein
MATTQSPGQLVIGITGYRVESGGHGVVGDRYVRIDLPPAVTEDHIALMQRDLTYMSEIAQQHPKDLTELQNAMLRHDFSTATQMARRIGLTEAQFAARGGGQEGVVAAAIVAVLVAAAVIEDAVAHAKPTVDPDNPIPPGALPVP